MAAFISISGESPSASGDLPRMLSAGICFWCKLRNSHRHQWVAFMRKIKPWVLQALKPLPRFKNLSYFAERWVFIPTGLALLCKVWVYLILPVCEMSPVPPSTPHFKLPGRGSMWAGLGLHLPAIAKHHGWERVAVTLELWRQKIPSGPGEKQKLLKKLQMAFQVSRPQWIPGAHLLPHHGQRCC